MKEPRRGVRWRLAGVLAGFAAAVALPASAGEGTARTAVDLGRLLPSPANTGKPDPFEFSPDALAPAGPAGDSDKCLPALPCGTRLLGAVRRNGAVMLEVPALRW